MAQFWSLEGLIPYSFARDLMLELVDLRHRGLISDTVLFLEHAPVITRGKGLQHGSDAAKAARHMPLPAHIPFGIDFSESERGGDLTYHGPGQLVVYPIFKLDGRGFSPAHDLGAYLRRLEQVISDELSYFGLNATRKENATGVWVKDKKVASIGIAIKKWVTYHGAAINVCNDLSPFDLFSPCGFNSEVMTRIEDLSKRPLPEHWRDVIETRLARALSSGQKAVEIRKIPVDPRAIAHKYVAPMGASVASFGPIDESSTTEVPREGLEALFGSSRSP